MQKIDTHLGLALIRAQSYSKTKGKIFLRFPENKNYCGEQKVTAQRLGTAGEPNTYEWRCQGLSGFHPRTIISGTAQAALHAYLRN